MCGRFAQGFAVRAIAEQLERGEMGIDDIRDLDNHYPSFNVAPTTFQPVYRRDRSGEEGDRSGRDGTRQEEDGRDQSRQVEERDAFGQEPGKNRHVLQSMKWGLIPFWTKRAPDHSSQLKTINCRDDSLTENRGMWNAMKGRKRCVIPVQGYYEWLKAGPKEKIPHFTKRTDGNMMMLGGLYDCVQYEGSQEALWTFTIITTAARSDLAWLHDRMPLILEPGTEAIHHWLDDDAWGTDLIELLTPYKGDLDCYPVKKEVGKVGNNSAEFIVPLDSKANKSNIANFFLRQNVVAEIDTSKRAVDDHDTENNAPLVDLENDDQPGKQKNDPKKEEMYYNKQEEKDNLQKEEKPELEKGILKETLYEDDLPFRFIPSHLETRPLETIDVYTAVIDAKTTGKAIQFINAKLKRASEDLSYLKRIKSSKSSRPANKKVKLEDASPEPEMEILLCSCASQTEESLRTLLAENDIDLQPRITKVSKYPPLTPLQFSNWCQLWPLSWRVPAQRQVKMTRADFEECERTMDNLLDSAALMASSPDLPVSAIAWDPVQKREIARSSDHRMSSGHPLKHAIMNLVESVAAYEVIRRLENPDSPAQYLCSGLSIFVTHEPCTMCCMALLHSRVARVFYAVPMHRTGGFESNYGIHWRSELNHRFSVFGGWKEERVSLIDDSTLVEHIDTINPIFVDNLEHELYSNHVPRSFTDPEPENGDGGLLSIIKEEEEEEMKEEGIILHAKSQIRKPRPKLAARKKTPKMTDFFTKRP